MVGGRVSTLSFCTWISSCPSTICWKHHSFPIEWSWHPCWQSVDHKCKSLFLDSQCSSIDHTVLIIIALQKVLKLGNVNPPNLFFLCKVVLAILGPLNLQMNFRISLSNSATKPARFLIKDWVESVDQFGKYCHLCNIKSSDHECGMIFFESVQIYLSISLSRFLGMIFNILGF